MSDLLKEVRYAVRGLLRTPAFTIIAVFSLTLGITANTAVFVVARAVLYRPLPVDEPENLNLVYWRRADQMRGISQYNSGGQEDKQGQRYNSNYSYPVYQRLKASGSELAEVFGFNFLRQLHIGIDGRALAASGIMVSGNYFSGLGLTPILGRVLDDNDDRAGAEPVIVISHDFWKRDLGASPEVVGSTLNINGHPFTIVGVTPPGFVGISQGGSLAPPTDLTVPLSLQPTVIPRWTPSEGSLFSSEDIFWVRVMARLKHGVSEEQLQSVLSASFENQLRASSLSTLNQAESPEIRLFPGASGLNSLRRNFETPILILTGVVVLVIIIACVNLASLALARGVARQRDSWIRLALGSGHLRLARQVVVESLVLAAAAGALGSLLALWVSRILLAALATNAGRVAVPISADWQLFGIAAIVSCGAGLLFGFFPAVRLLRSEGVQFVKPVALGTGASRLAGGRFLVLVQVAVSVPLLVGALLFLRTAHNLNRVDPGFEPDGLVLFRLDPSLNGYDREGAFRFYEDVLERLEAIPGVTSATLIENALVSGWISNTGIRVEDSESRSIHMNRVGPRFFETLRMPLLYGRDFGPLDDTDAPLVAIINETAAREFFDSPSPIGRYLTRTYSGEDHQVEVVGVVQDSKYASLRKETVPTMFLPYRQSSIISLFVVVRSSSVTGLGERIRAAVADVDWNVPVTNLRSQDEQITASLGTERVFTGFLVFFGCLALLLAFIGLHGVTAYAVSRRTGEIGLRIALGARQSSVLWLILRQVVVLAGSGLLIGVLAAFAATRVIRTMLFGIGPNDPVSLLAAVIVMFTVAIISGLIPAYRASRLDAIEALRAE